MCIIYKSDVYSQYCATYLGSIKSHECTLIDVLACYLAFCDYHSSNQKKSITEALTVPLFYSKYKDNMVWQNGNM